MTDSAGVRPDELADTDRAPWVIDVRALRKRHGSVTLLNDLTLQVARGTVCALIGANGSGKTTLLKILLGMSRHDGGDCRVFGLSVDGEANSLAIRQRTGFVSETKETFAQVSVRRCIDMTRACYPAWRASRERELLERFALPPAQRVSRLSKGMRAKLAMLLACCRGAELLLLDEPTDGLDPMSAEQVLQSLVAMVADEGITVLLSSHQLHEVERIADNIAVMHEGRVVLRGDLDDLRQNVRRIEFVLPHAVTTPALPEDLDVLHSTQSGARWSVLARGAWAGDVERASADLAAYTGALSANVHAVGLRELFLAVSGDRRGGV